MSSSMDYRCQRESVRGESPPPYVGGYKNSFRAFAPWRENSPYRRLCHFRYSPDVQTLVEDFLQYLRHERGQAEHTQKTYAALLNKFTDLGGQTEPDGLEIGRAEASHGVPPARARTARWRTSRRNPSSVSAAKVFISKSPRCGRFIALPRMKNCCRPTSRKICRCRAAGSGCPRR